MIILNRKFKATEILRINTNQLINESKYLHTNDKFYGWLIFHELKGYRFTSKISLLNLKK